MAQRQVIIQGLKWLSTPFPKSNPWIKRKESAYLFVKSFLTGQIFFVFYEGTTAAGITLNEKKFGQRGVIWTLREVWCLIRKPYIDSQLRQ